MNAADPGCFFTAAPTLRLLMQVFLLMYDNFSSDNGRSRDDPDNESLLDSYTGKIKKNLPWLPRFMSENLWGYIPGLLAAIFCFSMWEFSSDDNVRVLELNRQVLAGFNSTDDVRRFLGADWYKRNDTGRLEYLIYKYIARLDDITDQEYECFVRKHDKRVKISVYPGKKDIESRTNAFVRAEKAAYLDGNDRKMTRKELWGEIAAFRVRQDDRRSWYTDKAEMEMNAEELDRFVSEEALRQNMLQGCDSEDD